MGGFTIVTDTTKHDDLSLKEVKQKESLYRGLWKDYRIIYPDGTTLNVQFER